MKVPVSAVLVLGLLLLVSVLLNIHQLVSDARLRADAKLRAENDSLLISIHEVEIKRLQKLADAEKAGYDSLKKRYERLQFKPTNTEAKTDSALAAIIREKLTGGN